MEYKVLGLNDLEDLNYLAEEILRELRVNHLLFSDEGEYLYYNVQQRKELMDRNIELIESGEHSLEFRNNRKLEELSFVDIIKMSHKDIIDNYLKQYLPKARGIMRRGHFSLPLMIVDETISDDYLDNLFALRYKEDLKLWAIQWYMKKTEKQTVDNFK